MTDVARAVAEVDGKEKGEDKKFKFSVTHTDTVEFKKVLESMFGITTFPKVVVQTKIGDKKNYVYSESLEKDKIIEFVIKVGKKVIKEGFEDILTIAKLDGTLNDSP